MNLRANHQKTRLQSEFRHTCSIWSGVLWRVGEGEAYATVVASEEVLGSR